MPSLGVIVHFYVFKGFDVGILQIIQSTILQEFCFDATETRLHKSIVLGIFSLTKLNTIEFGKIS